jgi:hypothetical protein
MSDDLFTSKDDLICILDSRNASQYFNSTFNSHMRFDFANSINMDTRAIKIECSVVQFDAANSLYNINENNSFLSITVSGETTGYNVPYGNYNIETFMTYLSSALGGHFSISYSSINNKITLVHSASEFTINSTSTIYSVMGFGLGVSYTSIGGSLTMPFTVNFNGVQSLNIHFENINTNNIDSTSRTRNSIIATIPVNPDGSVISYTKNYDFHFSINTNTIDYIDIAIRDNLGGNLVNFNNQHFNLVLQFSVYHDIDRFGYMNSFHNILKRGYVSAVRGRF